MWETWIRSLGWGDPLEVGMATHSSICAWEIPGTQKKVVYIILKSLGKNPTY